MFVMEYLVFEEMYSIDDNFVYGISVVKVL